MCFQSVEFDVCAIDECAIACLGVLMLASAWLCLSAVEVVDALLMHRCECHWHWCGCAGGQHLMGVLDHPTVWSV